ncbi:MAG: nucleotidyltransferase family protein [Thermoproteus sp.]
MKAFLLAAGLGTRLRPLTYFAPKPLANIGDKTILDYAVEWLRSNGAEIYVVGFYMQDVLRRYVAEFHPEVVFVPSRKLLGTAGQLYYAKEYISDEPVLAAPSDVLTDLKIAPVLEAHVKASAKLTIVGQEVEASLRFGVLETTGGRLAAWREKPKFKYVVSTGIYVVEGSVVRRLEEKYLDFNHFAESLMPDVVVYPSNAKFYDIGTLEDLKAFLSARRTS